MSIHNNKFEFCTKENEQIDAIIKVYEEKNSVIHGLVVDCKNKPVKDAVVKLLQKITTPHGTKLIPLTHAFTDSCGEFIFGPLCPNRKYVIKVWFDNVSIRKICFDSNNCDDDCSCIQSGDNTSYPTCDCEDSFLTYNTSYNFIHESHNHKRHCDCEEENISGYENCDCKHESHNHKHLCDCKEENITDYENCDCQHESHSHKHNCDCDEEDITDYENCDCQYEIHSHKHNCDCDEEDITDYENCDCQHESHSHKHNCDCDEEDITDYKNCDCEHESLSRKHDCDCDEEDITDYENCDCEHESHSHKHNCDQENLINYDDSDSNNDIQSALEEFQKKFQILCNSNDKEQYDNDHLDLPMKKSKRNHNRRNRRQHKEGLF